ncbi:ribonuclease H2 subunit A-like [Clavelina lepadiformis]|uniref:ribonuclease H2 subunit A-like n=1 Tax=Clavelina lepadiformis TaxID=159417 RepID=UPI0040436180
MRKLKMEVDAYMSKNDENYKFHSTFGEKLKCEPCILGIDEAGRGPVLGPMVYAACFCPVSSKEDLANMGCDDSKVLKEEQRETLFEKLNAATSDFIGWIIHILSPNYLSTSMLSRSKYNLNSISHDTAIDLVKTVTKLGVDVKEIYVDTVGPPDVYQAKLQRIFPQIKVTVEKKADAKYPVVSAASICAKVCRDKVVNEWVFSESPDIEKNYGSGYPSDPATKTWLRKNVDRIFGFPNFVRFSWSTASKILETEAVKVTWPDDDEEEGDAASNTPAITSFFAAKKTPEIRHAFFRNNKLTQVESF